VQVGICFSGGVAVLLAKNKKEILKKEKKKS
jgi:hypothetical protein